MTRAVAMVTVAAVSWIGLVSGSVASAASTVGVTPSTGLVDGQTVTITAAGFVPGTGVFVATCPPGAVKPLDCDSTHYLSQTADSAGTVTIQYQVHRVLQAGIGGVLDCAFAACTIGATGDPFGNGDGDPQVPITFAVPHLTITVESLGTLDAGDDAVVRAHVSCDVATPISMVSVITQGAEARPFRIDPESCDPARPTQLFVAGHPGPTSQPLALGAVQVDVTAAPFPGYQVGDPRGAPTTATASSDLIDQQAVATAITGLLADPANVDLRQQMVEAMQTRARQDPIFAAALAAAFAAAVGPT